MKRGSIHILIPVFAGRLYSLALACGRPRESTHFPYCRVECWGGTGVYVTLDANEEKVPSLNRVCRDCMRAVGDRRVS